MPWPAPRYTFLLYFIVSGGVVAIGRVVGVVAEEVDGLLPSRSTMRNACPGVRTPDQFSLGPITTSCTALFSTMASLCVGAASALRWHLLVFARSQAILCHGAIVSKMHDESLLWVAGFSRRIRPVRKVNNDEEEASSSGFAWRANRWPCASRRRHRSRSRRAIGMNRG